MTATVTFREAGVMPHLRDAVRSLIGAADDAGTTWQLGEEEIADGLALLGEMRQLMDVAEVAMVREGLERGLPAQDAWSPHDWVTRAGSAAAPAPQTRHVAQVLRVAKGEPRVADVTQAFTDGDLPLGKAEQLVRFDEQVSPVADPVELADAMAVLLEGARDGIVPSGPDGRGPHDRVPGLTEKELAVAITRTGRLLKPALDQEREDRRAKGGRGLYRHEGPAGMTTFRVVLDPEGASVVDSAVAALSAPVKGPEGRSTRGRRRSAGRMLSWRSSGGACPHRVRRPRPTRPRCT